MRFSFALRSLSFPRPDIALARRRVNLKRYLARNGVWFREDDSTHRLVSLVKEFRSKNEPIGTWRMIWAGCAPGYGEPLYVDKPIYGLQETEYPGKVRILTDYRDFGADCIRRQWIYADANDVTLR